MKTYEPHYYRKIMDEAAETMSEGKARAEKKLKRAAIIIGLIWIADIAILAFFYA